MKELVLYNHSGCGNRGCEAIVRSTAALFPGRCLIFSNTREEDMGLEKDGVGQVLSPVIAPLSPERFINAVGFRLGMPREHEVTRKYTPVIRKGAGHLCLSVGGDTYCYGEQEHMRFINRALRKKGSRLVLWGCSLDPELLTPQLISELRDYDLMVPRESITAAAFRQADLPTVQGIDPAFFLPSKSCQLPGGWDRQRCVGLNVSPLVLDKSGNRDRTYRAFESLIRFLLVEGMIPVLVPHVMWAHDNDDALLSQLAASFGDQVIRIPGSLNAMQYKYIVSNLRCLITARTHLSIAAYSMGVPVLVIGYSCKARGIARDIYGTEDGHLLQVQKLQGEEELQSEVRALLDRAQTEAAFLTDRMTEYRKGMDGAREQVEALWI